MVNISFEVRWQSWCLNSRSQKDPVGLLEYRNKKCASVPKMNFRRCSICVQFTREPARAFLQITGIPANHYEPFQILQYQEGQFYRRHHDSPDANGENPAGHRILTFFFYLNDVEEGGETMFTDLNVSISPKKVRLRCQGCAGISRREHFQMRIRRSSFFPCRVEP